MKNPSTNQTKRRNVLIVASALLLPSYVFAQGAYSAPSAPASSNAAEISSSREADSPSSAVVVSSSTTVAGKLDNKDTKFLESIAKESAEEISLSQLAADRASDAEVRAFAKEIVDAHKRANNDLVQLAQRRNLQIEGLALISAPVPAASASISIPSEGAQASISSSPSGTQSSATISREPGTPASTSVSVTPANSGSSSSPMSASAATPIKENDSYKKLVKLSGKEFDQEYIEQMVDTHEQAEDAFAEMSKDADDADVRAFATRHLATIRSHHERANELKNRLD